MKILVVGPGAMGCLFGAGLARAGHDVTLLDYRPERAQQIMEKGVRVETPEETFHVKIPAITAPPPDSPDLVLVCVKANKTREAALPLLPSCDTHTRVLSLQNGLGNLEALVEIFGPGRVLGGVTAQGATVLGDGHVRHAGRGETLVGPAGPEAGPVSPVVRMFAEAGFPAREAPDVHQIIWGKLIVNVGINALTALTRLKNGRLAHVQGTRLVMADAVAEAAAVAGAMGIDLPYEDPLARVLEVCAATADNVASMLQDVRNRRPTEVAHINGAIVREGSRLGIPTPVNRTLASLVEALQETYGEGVF